MGYVANVRRCFPDRIRPKQFIYFFLLRNTVTCVWLLGFKIVTAFLYGECNLVVVLVQFCFFPSIMSGQMGWCVAFIRRPTNRPGHVFLVFLFLFSFASFFLQCAPKDFVWDGLCRLFVAIRIVFCFITGRPPSAPAELSSVRVCSA